MDNIKEIEITDPLTGDVTKHIIIDRGNDEYTSMPKVVWDELEAQREQSGTL